MRLVDGEGAVLGHALETWRGLPKETRPWGMWLTCHAPLPEETGELDSEACPALGAWFMDAGGMRAGGVASVKRFLTVIFAQPWCSRPVPEHDALFEGNAYPIGQAAFAPYLGSRDVYLEMIIGKRHGYGVRLRVEGGEVHVRQELWRS